MRTKAGVFGVHCRTRIAQLAGGILCEQLEQRQLLAVIAWDGGATGNGTSWTDPTNWAGDVLPGAADDVTIGATGTSPLVTLPAATTINVRSFALSRALDLRGTLATTQPSTVAAAGSIALTGGVISGGTIASSGAITISNPGGTMSGAAVNGEVVIGNSATLTLSGAVSVTTVRISGANSTLAFAPSTSLSSTAIIIDGATGGARSITMNGTAGVVTWASSVSLSSTAALGTGATLGVVGASGAMTLNNSGTISFSSPSRPFNINAATLNNSGTIQANAGTISLNGAGLTNTGSIIVGASGAVNVGGSFTAASLGSVQNNAGGLFNITGTVTNTGSTLTLNATTGSWNLAGGLITGGTVNLTGGSTLIATGTGGTIDGAAVNGEVTIGVSSRLTLSGAVSIATVRLLGSNTALAFAPGTSLSSTAIIIDGAGGGERAITMNGNAGVVTWSSTVTLTSTAVVGTSNLFVGASGASGAMTLISSAAISFATPGRTMSINTASFTNAGSVQALQGTISIASPAWTNSGLLAVGSGGALNLGGALSTAGLGTLQGAAGGVINITGVVTNTGQTLAITAGTGSIGLLGGSIIGGTVNISDGARLQATSTGGTLDGVTINGEVSMAVSSARLTLAGTVNASRITLSGANTSLLLAPGATLASGLVSVEGAGGGTRQIGVTADGTATIGPGAVVQTAAGLAGSVSIGVANLGGAMTLLNRGVIRSQVANRPITINPAGGFTNAGTLESLPGAVIAVTGNYQQAATGRIITQIAGLTSAQFGRLSISGVATLDGSFAAPAVNGFILECFEFVDVVTAASFQGAFESVTLPPTNSTVDQPQLRFIDGTTLRVYMRHTADFNDDGALDPDDLADFIAGYFSGSQDPAFDLDGNGTVDPDDLSDFITRYFTPC